MNKALLFSQLRMRAAMTLFAAFFVWVSASAQWAIITCDPYEAGQVQIGTDTNWGSLIDNSCLDMPQPGDVVYFTFEPFANYTFTGFRYEGISSDDVTALPNGLYSFVMPTDVQLVQIFVEFEYSPPPVVGVTIDEEHFPDENFRTWLRSQSYGQDGVLEETELAAVTKISAQGRGIQDLTGIEYFTALTHLYVGNLVTTPEASKNRITSIDLSGNSLLRKLDLYDTGIASLDLTFCPNLEDLSCGKSSLTELDVTNNPGLKSLECCDNQLTGLDLSGTPNLYLLQCSGNQLTELDFTGNPNLEQLYCDNNQLEELDLSNQPLLMILNCNDNQLTSLTFDSDNLFQLYCYNNRIQGQAMDDLIGCLPDFPGAYMVVIDLESETEQNAITDEQVAAARAKGWSVEACYDDDTVPYPFDENDHHYVDLGLTSGTLWATTNIGAITPYRTGLMFAWGDTEGHGSDPSDGYLFSWGNYKWCEEIDEEAYFTKYCTDSSRGLDGFEDGKYGLSPEDDAAYVNWGPEWRMPTREQFDELLNECTWTRMLVREDYWGYEVEGPNGNTIFLPDTGWRIDDMLNDGGSYWTRTSDPDDAGVGAAYNFGWYFLSEEAIMETFFGGRLNGQCVRPVINVSKTIELADASDNSDAVEAAAAGGDTYDATLAGRTLYKDGAWNTLCLPFTVSDGDDTDGVTFSGTPLEGATVMTLGDASFSGGTLTLDFEDATTIEAGKPYIVKWEADADYVDDDDHNLVEPTFTGVVFDNATAGIETDYVDFVGTMSPVTLEAGDRESLYLSATSTLYYPDADVPINSFRAYFQLKGGITAGDLEGEVNAFVLHFGGESTAIKRISDKSGRSVKSDQWFTLDGRRLNAMPTTKGIYIQNGHKIVIK